MEQLTETNGGRQMQPTAAILIATAQQVSVHLNQIVLDFVVRAAHAGGLSALIAVGI